jgi:hypothetical protein
MLLTIAFSLGSLCAYFAIVAPARTRNAEGSSNHDVVDKWLQSLPDLPNSDPIDDKYANANSDNLSPQHSNINYDAPGGAFVMDTLLQTGMYAPMETLLFHHIILVGVLKSFVQYLIFFHMC